jgi:hypothetical protein
LGLSPSVNTALFLWFKSRRPAISTFIAFLSRSHNDAKSCLLRDVGENALRCSLLYLDVREREKGFFPTQKRSKAKYYTSARSAVGGKEKIFYAGTKESGWRRKRK